jgi:hypothetical protein
VRPRPGCSLVVAAASSAIQSPAATSKSAARRLPKALTSSTGAHAKQATPARSPSRTGAAPGGVLIPPTPRPPV